MTHQSDADRAHMARVGNIPLILQALQQAVREALLRHKQTGNPVAIWQDGKVVWIQPEDIPDWTREEHRLKNVGTEGGAVYPFFFTFHEFVSGNGFLVRVAARGRALMAKEEDGWWLLGVEPGGMAASGKTPQEVYLKFNAAFKSIIFDFAENAATFTDFEKEVRSFFSEVDGTDAVRWEEARNRFRGGAAIQEPSIQGLAMDKGDVGCDVVFERFDQRAHFSPQDNKLAAYATAA